MARNRHRKGKRLLFGYYKEYTEKGGFPEIIAGESKHSYIINLFDAIVTRDIVYRYKLRHIRTFRDIAIYLSGSYASEISYNRIKNIFGLGVKTLRKTMCLILKKPTCWHVCQNSPSKNRKACATVKSI